MWLSLVERCVRDAEVEGSNPFIPTTIFGCCRQPITDNQQLITENPGAFDENRTRDLPLTKGMLYL